MAKQYNLVGSVYDKYAKGNKYTDEEIIKIPGIIFKSIEDIDRYTAAFNKFDFTNNLDERYKCKNIFSIRITNNKEVYYQSVLFDNENLIELIDGLILKKVYTSGRPQTIKVITSNNTLFYEAWKEIKAKILEKDIDWLYNVFGEKSNYSFLINRYINGDPTDIEYPNLLLALESAFREYNVFRKYLIYKEKNKYNTAVSNLKIKSDNIPSKTNLSKIAFGSNIDYTSADKDYEQDDFAFLTEEEKLAAYGEGNEDIEEYRRKH